VAISKNKDENQERIVCNLIFVLIFKTKKKTPCFKILQLKSFNTNQINSKRFLFQYHCSQALQNCRKVTTRIQSRLLSLPTLPLLDILGEPLEAITIAHLANNTAHENFHGPDIGLCKIHLPLASCEIGQA
jgi:hypothetical protein